MNFLSISFMGELSQKRIGPPIISLNLNRVEMYINTMEDHHLAIRQWTVCLDTNLFDTILY